MSRALKPDAQPFDEVRIYTAPRFKTSGLSGDEWRISGRIELRRNGQVCHEASFRNVETAIDFLKAEWWRACDDAKGYFAGEGDFCDQEGCQEKAVVTYRVKRGFSKERPHDHSWPLTGMFRRFCQRHSKRGDAAFDDCDDNYELVEGMPISPPLGDVSESSTVVLKASSPSPREETGS